jgi:hypothetical protein
MAGPPLSKSNPVDWQRTLQTALVVWVACVCLFGIYTALTYKPHLVYPPGYGDEAPGQLLQLQMPSGEGYKPVSKELIDRLIKAYGLDATCTIGKKYGAVCQDGVLTYDRDASACSDHGGVRDWVVCR